MLKEKPYIELRKAVAEKRLALRMETLQSQGASEKQIQRDTKVRHFKGKIRQAQHQLADITELERLIARKAEIKTEKRAAGKAQHPHEQHAPNPDKRKAKRERKIAAEVEE